MAATRQPLRIAHGLFTWQEPRAALEACLRSTVGVADEVIIADGLIQGVDPIGLPFLSDLGWLADADYLPARVPISAKEWRSLSAACTWILHKAKELGCDWLLYIDGDQELHNGERLREWLQGYSGDAFPIPRADNGRRHIVPWQLIRVSAFRRYIAGCFVIEHERFGEMRLTPDNGWDHVLCDGNGWGVPWISHHPERRPPHRYSHRLGHLETVLEPPPLDVPAVHLAPVVLEPRSTSRDTPREGGPMTEPTATELQPTGTPEWFCDQCGARFNGPGVCSNAHPPNELKSVADTAAAESGAADTQPADTANPLTDSPAAAPHEPEPERAAPAALAPIEQPAEQPAEPTPAEPQPVSPLDEARSLVQRALDLLHSL